jgi:hypothetical protein
MAKSVYQFQLPVIMALVLAGALPGHSQHTAALKVEAFQTIYGLYNMGFEQAFNNHLSAAFSVQGGNYINTRLTPRESYSVSGFGAVGAIRYYPFTRNVVAPRGFFGFGALRYTDFAETYINSAAGNRYKVGGNIINAGAGVGYKFAYRRIGVEAFIRWGTGRLKSEDDEYRNNIPEFHRKSIEEQWRFPHIDFALCYMFSPFLRKGD